MTITNIQTASAYPGEGVKVTLDKANVDAMEFLSWAYPGMELTSDASGDKGVIDTVDRQGNSFIVVPIQPNLTFMGSDSFKLKPTDTISFSENKIGNIIWKLVDETTTLFLDGSSIPLVTNSTQWSNNTSGAYCHYNNDPVTYPSKIYNKYAVLRGISTAVNGWRVPTLTDVLDLLKAANPNYTSYGNQSPNLPYNGSILRSVSLGGANFKGFNAINTGVRNAAGIFSLLGPYYHVFPNLQSLPPWQINFSNFNNLSRTFYFSILATNSQYQSSAFLSTGYGIRLCKNYTPNVVITK